MSDQAEKKLQKQIINHMIKMILEDDDESRLIEMARSYLTDLEDDKGSAMTFFLSHTIIQKLAASKSPAIMRVLIGDNGKVIRK